MPTFVDPKVCDSCAALSEPQCVHICPNDLMILDAESRKGFNQEPEMCSECFACVKMCPQEAIEVRGYSDFVPLGAFLKPHRTDSEIKWDVKFRDGRELEFTFPVRTTPVGSTDPYKDFAEPGPEDAAGQGLAGESIWLGVDSLSTIQG